MMLLAATVENVTGLASPETWGYSVERSRGRPKP